MIILGIDPGSIRVGYGLIKKNKGKLKFLKAGLLKIQAKEKTRRLLELEKSIQNLLKKYRPDLAVLEKLFFMKNQKTALEVAESRGVLILSIVKAGVPLLECSPSEIKTAVTGYGLANKKAVAQMCAKILKIKEMEEFDDASDALAAAIAGSSKMAFIGVDPVRDLK